MTNYIKLIFLISFLILNSIFLIRPAQAVVDPLSTPNNKFGVHIITGSPDEASPAAQMVNSSGGDWGYITVLIESKNRNHDQWQAFFNDLRRRHLIPLVRIATEPEGNYWKIPYNGEEQAWADFLDSLVWPTKNRYVIIYNEPNQGQEWAGKVDPASYAQVLDKTITALKNKNPDFFVLNAGLDASAPDKYPSYADETTFLSQMEAAVPGIFNKLDGWVSHSYPNPGFAGSPDASGRGTVRTWAWELNYLKNLGVNKTLPVFITETGWKHAEGLDYDKSLPNADTVADYLKDAFTNAWNSSQIVAVTPFLLNYQQAPFDHFSFKKLTGEPQNLKILGASYPDYYPPYQAMMDLPKVAGHPFQENKAALVKGTIYPSIVAGESYTIPLTFKNTGQSIWEDGEPLELRVLSGGDDFGIQSIQPAIAQKVEPGQNAIFNVNLKAPQGGDYQITLQLFHGGKAFDQNPFVFNTKVKSPVILQVKTSLWGKKNSAGSYLLTILNNAFKSSVEVTIDDQGISKPLESRYLLPDYPFTFTLHKPFYKPKSINVQVVSGINQLNFGTLEPDFLSAILNPKEFWDLLPF